jgi:NAD(P)H-dependent FMN reductase
MEPTASLLVIVGSTRPGRLGLPVAHWFVERAKQDGRFEVDLADLALIALPLLDESAHPRLQQYRHQHTKDWSARVAAADGVVLVTAEYNHGYPAPLKNALDYLHAEWMHKPVGFVSYGGVSAGTRAVQQLVQVVRALRMLPLVESVAMSNPDRFLQAGAFEPDEAARAAAAGLLDAVYDASVTATRRS